MNFLVFCVCLFNSAIKLDSTSSASSIIAWPEEGSSTSLLPEKSQGNLTTMHDSSETTQHDASNKTPITAGRCVFLSDLAKIERISQLSTFMLNHRSIRLFDLRKPG